MNVLKKHVEKVVFGVVVLVCAVFVYFTLQSSESDIGEMANLESYHNTINEELRKQHVSDKYAWSPGAADKVKYQEAFEATLERGTKKVEEEVPPNVAYPTLPRPYVDRASKPPDPDELTHQEYAELQPLGEVKAEGDHGRVFVTFRVPQKMKYMEAVRVEVFRGEDAKKIDLSKPYGTVDLGPEENPEAAAAVAEKEAAAPEKGADTESAAQKRRRERAEGETKEGPRGRDKKVAAVEEIPVEYADLKVFSDTRVEPKKTYYYQARLVTRMTVAEGRRFEKKDAGGKLTGIVIVHAPKNAQTVPGANSGTVLYPGPLTGVISASTPDNFQIRLAGYSGKIDPLGTPDYKKTRDYKGKFAVRVWVTDAQAWKEQILDIAPGEPLKGTLTYKAPGSEELKSYPFDSGYKFIEIKMVETVREIEVEEPEIGPDGNPVMDPVTKQPKRIKRIRKTDPMTNEVAVLENIQDKKLEEFPKRADFEKRKDALGVIQRIADQEKAQEKSRPKKKEKGN